MNKVHQVMNTIRHNIGKLTLETNEELLDTFPATLRGDLDAAKISLGRQFQELHYKTQEAQEEVSRAV